MDRAITVMGAYARDYTSKADIQQAWADGKDFKEAVSGSMINRREADRMGLEVWGRYAKLSKKILLRPAG